MAHFIDVDVGRINLDHAAKITTRRGNGRNTTIWSFYTAAADLLGTLAMHDSLDPIENAAPILPATPGATAIIITVAPENHRARPDAAALWTDLHPIIGWRLHYDSATPILIEAPSSNQATLIQMPDGKLLETNCCCYPNLEDAKNAVLRRFQSEWDRTHAAEVAA